MEVENKNKLKKNLNYFESIIVCFFSKKGLNCLNYRPEYLKFAKELKKNIKELELILEQENLENIWDCIDYFESNVSKINVHNLNKMCVVLKRMHYTNIAEYLRYEKKNLKFKTFVYKKFFKELEDHVCEHFLLTNKVYDQNEKIVNTN